MEDLEAAGALTREQLLRRGAALGVGATLLGGSVAGALAGTRASSSNLELWSWQVHGNGYDDVFAAAGKRWQAKQNGKFTAEIVDYNSYWTKFKTTAAGGNPPDVMEMSWTGQYHDLIQANTLLPLDKYLGQFPKFFPSVMDSLRYKGKVYAIPLDLNTLTIGYNKDIFAKLNLKVPKTFDELLALAKPIRDGGYQPLSLNVKDQWPAGDVWFAQVAYIDGTKRAIRQAEAGQVKWTDRRFLQAALNAQKLQKSGLLADGADSLDFNGAMALFASGHAAMVYPVGNFDTGIIDKTSGGKVKYDLFPFPPLRAGQKPVATGGPAIIWSVPANAKNPDGAVAYMKLTTDAVGNKELIKRNFIPSSKANASSNPSALYRRMVSFQPTAQTRAIFVPKVYTALLNSMTAVLSGNGSPQDVVSSMAKAV